mmetsp:Transcript_10686/g.19514  ORF Transcript_10686/g.19514 Transcript_10686/m.19514 type:complete len:218 (+) Transcript_10686:563-1216(+)
MIPTKAKKISLPFAPFPKYPLKNYPPHQVPFPSKPTAPFLLNNSIHQGRLSLQEDGGRRITPATICSTLIQDTMRGRMGVIDSEAIIIVLRVETIRATIIMTIITILIIIMKIMIITVISILIIIIRRIKTNIHNITISTIHILDTMRTPPSLVRVPPLLAPTRVVQTASPPVWQQEATAVVEATVVVEAERGATVHLPCQSLVPFLISMHRTWLNF